MSLFELLELSRKIALKLALWPQAQPTLVYRSRTVMTMVIVVTFALCLSYNSYLQLGDFVALSKSLYMLITIINTTVKLIVVVSKRDEILLLLRMLEEPCFLRHLAAYQDELGGFKRTAKMVMNVFWAEVHVTALFMVIYPVVQSLPLPFAFPHFNDGLFRYPFYAFESVSLYVAACGNASVDFFALGTISIAALQLKILNAKLRDTEKNVGERDQATIDRVTVEYLNECCHHYVIIEQYVKKLNEVLSVLVFVQMGSSIVAICNAGMMVFTVGGLSIEAVYLFFYMIGMIYQLGMYCGFGNVVHLESLEVLTSCYMSNWENRGPAARKTLFLLMERSKKPLQIKGIEFVSLTFGAFISILKWSYSYFALLKNYTDKTD